METIVLSSDDEDAPTLAQRLAAKGAASSLLTMPEGMVANVSAKGGKARASTKRKKVIAQEDSDAEEEEGNDENVPEQRACCSAHKRRAAAQAPPVAQALPAAPPPPLPRAVARSKGVVQTTPCPRVRAEPTAAAMQSYLRARATAVKLRTFDVSKLKDGVVATGRTIRPMAAWNSLWAPIREFMQNTIDHLNLFKDGGLHQALTLDRSEGDAGPTLTFSCGAAPVCAIEVAADELVIRQWHTFPLHPRALDTGVADTTKGGENTAGGFGDGFKVRATGLRTLRRPRSYLLPRPRHVPPRP